MDVERLNHLFVADTTWFVKFLVGWGGCRRDTDVPAMACESIVFPPVYPGFFNKELDKFIYARASSSVLAKSIGELLLNSPLPDILSRAD